MFPLKGHQGRERLQVGAEQIWGKGESLAPGEGGGPSQGGSSGPLSDWLPARAAAAAAGGRVTGPFIEIISPKLVLFPFL